MADLRPGSFLPTIKCSTCGNEIEITNLADHVCSTAPTAALQQTSNSYWDRPPSPPSSISSKGSNVLRPGRAGPPPRIDASAANKPYWMTGPMTPSESDGIPRSLSPVSMSPGLDPQRPSRTPLGRIATSPLFKTTRPDSEEYSLPQDCAFPTFTPAQLAPSPRTTKTPPVRKLERSRTDGADNMAPLSPKTNGGQTLLGRMASAARGPFLSRANKESDRESNSSKGSSGHARTASASSSIKDHITSMRSGNRFPARPAEFPMPNRPSTAGSEQSRERSSTLSSSYSRQEPRDSRPPPARPGRPNDMVDAFLEELQSPSNSTFNPPRLDERSRTFPTRKESQDEFSDPAIMAPKRTPTMPTMREAQRPVQSFPKSLVGNNPRSPRNADQSGVGRFQNRNGGHSRTDTRFDNAPPVPPLSTGQSIPVSMHSPTESSSSDGSNSFNGGSVSSRSSPPTSDAAGLSRRPSKVSDHDELTYWEEFAKPAPPKPLRASGRDRSSPNTLPTSPSPGRPRGPSLSQRHAPQPLPLEKEPLPSSLKIRSPDVIDPAVQAGMFPPQRGHRRNGSSRNENRPQRPNVDIPASGPSGRSVMTGEQTPTSERRPTSSKGSKGKCRGCSQEIFGKSVKAADGRLTGRYHKQCFVCRSCSDPFETADFYVLENQPYCERHYHQLNDSLCKSCDTGIEGQYLETDERKKFHLNCFSCKQCGRMLTDGYFEIKGKVLCERHAFQANNFLGATTRVEKRATRLMRT